MEENTHGYAKFEERSWPVAYQRAVGAVGVLLVAFIAALIRPHIDVMTWWEQALSGIGVVYMALYGTYLTADYIADCFREKESEA